MSITDNKITRWNNPIVNEADRPQRSASNMKEIFDSNSNQLRDALNILIDALASGGAEDIGAAVEGMEGQNVETILAELKGLIDSTGEDLDAVRAAVLPEGDGNTFLANDGTWKLPEVGAAANGLPEGGSPGDVLYKNSFTAYDGGWVSPEEAGLMLTAAYDPELTGTVLSAENANKLGGKEASEYGSPALIRTAALTVEEWTGEAAPFTQTVTVEGILADVTKQAILPAPDTASIEAWGAAGITCTAQAENALTFSCTTLPDSEITVSIVILEAKV